MSLAFWHKDLATVREGLARSWYLRPPVNTAVHRGSPDTPAGLLACHKGVELPLLKRGETPAVKLLNLGLLVRETHTLSQRVWESVATVPETRYTCATHTVCSVSPGTCVHDVS